jgi:hypothetical protein
MPPIYTYTTQRTGLGAQDGKIDELSLLGEIPRRSIKDAFEAVFNEMHLFGITDEAIKFAYQEWLTRKEKGRETTFPKDISEYIKYFLSLLNKKDTPESEIFASYKDIAEIFSKLPQSGFTFFSNYENNHLLNPYDLSIKIARYAQPKMMQGKFYTELEKKLKSKLPNSSFEILNTTGTPADALQGTDLFVIRTDKGDVNKKVYRFDLTSNPNKQIKFSDVKILQAPAPKEGKPDENYKNNYYIDKILDFVV